MNWFAARSIILASNLPFLRPRCAEEIRVTLVAAEVGLVNEVDFLFDELERFWSIETVGFDVSEFVCELYGLYYVPTC